MKAPDEANTEPAEQQSSTGKRYSRRRANVLNKDEVEIMRILAGSLIDRKFDRATPDYPDGPASLKRRSAGRRRYACASASRTLSRSPPGVLT
jgi:hypothetical protein